MQTSKSQAELRTKLITAKNRLVLWTMWNINLFIFIFLIVKSSASEYDEATVTVDEEDYARSWECRGYCGENVFRSGRLNDSPMKSRVLDAMMSSKILPLTKDKPDLFSSFTDQYDLPKGECSMF